MIRIVFWALLAAGVAAASGPQKGQQPLDRYLAEIDNSPVQQESSAGSLFTPSAALADMTREQRAYRTHDLVTIVVAERASATTRGSVSTARKGTAAASVGNLLGVTRVPGPLANMASLSGERQLDGQGETSRETNVATTVTARITRVLPNGTFVVEGTKSVVVNSERQLVSIRGIIRPADITSANTVRSDRIAYMEVGVNGKGVVDDAVKRPMFLYRLLLGLLPF